MSAGLLSAGRCHLKVNASSAGMTVARVVLPRPGGPSNKDVRASAPGGSCRGQVDAQAVDYILLTDEIVKRLGRTIRRLGVHARAPATPWNWCVVVARRNAKSPLASHADKFLLPTIRAKVEPARVKWAIGRLDDADLFWPIHRG